MANDKKEAQDSGPEEIVPEEIAKELDLTPELAHKEYARARKGFRTVLEDVISAHCAVDEGDIGEQCREVLQLLG